MMCVSTDNMNVALATKIKIIVQDIKINNRESNLNGLTVAQISDLHINKWNIELVEHAVEVLNKINPDMVVMTGDAICSGKKFIPDLTRIFKNIKASYGKFACLGNHDHSDGDDGMQVQQAYKNSDFQVLMNESVKVNFRGESLFIAGADDIELGRQDIEAMVKNIPQEATSLYLIHNPCNFNQFAQFKPDLVLAGHTHGGQIYFSFLNFIYKTMLHSHYILGLYSLEKSLLYVNSGIGNALISPVLFNKKFTIHTPRINSQPEISLFRFG